LTIASTVAGAVEIAIADNNKAVVQLVSVNKYKPPNTNNGVWAGIYWVGPYFNHWGDYPGYEVNDARAVTFWARGANGGERVEFKVGGMRDRRKPFRDSFGPLPVRDTWVTLTAQWKLYTIGLGDADTSSLLGGLCVVTNAANNPDGCTVFLDGIRVVGNGE